MPPRRPSMPACSARAARRLPPCCRRRCRCRGRATRTPRACRAISRTVDGRSGSAMSSSRGSGAFILFLERRQAKGVHISPRHRHRPCFHFLSSFVYFLLVSCKKTASIPNSNAGYVVARRRGRPAAAALTAACCPAASTDFGARRSASSSSPLPLTEPPVRPSHNPYSPVLPDRPVRAAPAGCCLL